MPVPLLVHPRYQPGAELGRGAQGIVLRVVDREAPGRALVAKLWRPGRFDASAIEAEFALLRRLDVPGLVGAHDLGRDAQSGAPFFVEDFVAGVTASEFIAQGGSARAERLFQVLAETATTLAALHQAAFVHGDIKPDHVRVSAEPQVFLLDLGAAVASTRDRHGQAPLATPAYAAPEVLAGERPSALSDLFSLGALGHALATGAPPSAGRAPLRTQAPWVPPSLTDLLERLQAAHPRDRPENAEAVLAALGVSGLSNARQGVPAPVGRERELQLLATPRRGVRYVAGPSGVGKSHLLREVATRALLAGRAVRRVAFPQPDALLVAQLITFLRGDDAAWPFSQGRLERGPLLLVLDDLQAAPEELVSALDGYRCRALDSGALDVLAGLRQAPDGAPCLELSALGPAPFRELCARLGVTNPAQVAELGRISSHHPGWLVAARGRVPLTRDMVLERTRELSTSARQLLAVIALFGGQAPRALAERAAAPEPGDATGGSDELLCAGLVTRHASGGAASYALQTPELAQEIAATLGSFELAERAAQQALASDWHGPRALLALAGSAFPPTTRRALLERAADTAERAGLPSEQTDALFALAASPELRTPELLTRLERLTRSAGNHHPQVLTWLIEGAEQQPRLAPLARRRQADQAARAGDFALAERHAAAALAAAVELGDALAEALALATRGAVALFHADVGAAEATLRDARARLATLEVTDVEELARVEHNVGVVALYTDRVDDAAQAFERSLSIKRRLGDRAGVRSCLLNLGLALARQGRYDAAAQTLTEAHALAQALRQHAGRAWCLAARADVEVRRSDARSAERFIAEAEAISQAPASVRADLCILRGQVALLAGDATAAAAAVAALSPALRASDAMIDARACVVEAGSLLASLPAAPRRAARLAIAAMRAARRAKLFEVESQARLVLQQARQNSARRAPSGYTSPVAAADPLLWRWLEAVAAGADFETAVTSLLGALRDASGAERVLLVACDDAGRPQRAWGVDLEGFALASALERCDPELASAALAAQGPLYQREVETRAGRGSRLALAVPGGAAVLVLEQRFRIGSFDALGSEQSARFSVLCGLALRLAPRPGALQPTASVPLAEPESLESTALPLAKPRRRFAAIVGGSRALENALARLDSAVDSELPVLIVGETGTGKELFARALHDSGPRALAPFIAVNCAAIPEALFESELFGHARGAFTGADRARPGLLARAEGGTLFLDELGELPLSRQATLLRVLESRRFRPVGSDEERAANVRVVSATNRVLETEVARGNFRQDLLYRVNVIEVRVPPLRSRSDDIAALVQAFLARMAAGVTLSSETLAALESYAWPGNVRELEHQLQRLLALGLSHIELGHLPRGLRQGAAAPSGNLPTKPASRDTRGEVELALQHAGGNITHAARALGLTRHGLKKRMLRLGLRVAARAGEPS